MGKLIDINGVEWKSFDLFVNYQDCSVTQVFVPPDYSGVYTAVDNNNLVHTLVFVNGELESHIRRKKVDE